MYVTDSHLYLVDILIIVNIFSCHIKIIKKNTSVFVLQISVIFFTIFNYKVDKLIVSYIRLELGRKTQAGLLTSVV